MSYEWSSIDLAAISVACAYTSNTFHNTVNFNGSQLEHLKSLIEYIVVM